MSRELSLIVTEASTKDVGKGFARVHPGLMKQMNADAGDIVEIAGKRKTVARLMPSFSRDGQNGLIMIDGITRKNAQVSLNDRVTLSKIRASPAASVTLQVGPSSRKDLKYLGKMLDGQPVVKDDFVRVASFGTRYQDFAVIDTRPRGAIILRPGTTVQLSKSDEPVRTSNKISYEDVGGVGREIKKIREMIELPLKYPELFERAGIDPPKGILLYGPPGTGKTLIARAVASETDAFFVHVNGPEIMHKHYGESEARLREIFEEAGSRAPGIIFIDEIDVIAPRREKIQGDVEKRVVGQLLALMDGLQSRGQVVVIGATNIPNALDPALRRPGRFDREISINVPDKNGRMEILDVHTRGMPLGDDVDLSYLADVTHGYVGADLAALCREAAMGAIRKIMPEPGMSADDLPTEVIMGMTIVMDDFQSALADIIPSTTREVFVEVPDVSWGDIGGLEALKHELQKTIEWPLKYAALFDYARTRPPRGVLMYGPPGTGKTLIAKAVASESKANFISIKGPELLSKWVGESESGIREIFKKARQAAPCIIFFDEMDAIAPSRGRGGDTQVTERMVSQLLTEMDGIEELKGVTVLAATNRLDMIDAALLRPGRFDLLMEVPLPGREGLKEILKVHTRQKPLARDVNLDRLADQMSGYSGADIASVVREAAMLAIKEYIEKGGDMSAVSFKIRPRHFEEAVGNYKKMRGTRDGDAPG